MNIAKALKKKNQLAGEIAKLSAIIQQENSQLNENKSRFDVLEAMKSYQDKVDELIALKTAIAKANDGIWEKIFTIVELKGRIAFLRNLNTREGTFRERDYTQTVENKWSVTINAKMVQDEIESLEQKITELQDEVDDYNHAINV